MYIILWYKLMDKECKTKNYWEPNSQSLTKGVQSKTKIVVIRRLKQKTHAFLWNTKQKIAFLSNIAAFLWYEHTPCFSVL